MENILFDKLIEGVKEADLIKNVDEKFKNNYKEVLDKSSSKLCGYLVETSGEVKEILKSIPIKQYICGSRKIKDGLSKKLPTVEHAKIIVDNYYKDKIFLVCYSELM